MNFNLKDVFETELKPFNELDFKAWFLHLHVDYFPTINKIRYKFIDNFAKINNHSQCFDRMCTDGTVVKLISETFLEKLQKSKTVLYLQHIIRKTRWLQADNRRETHLHERGISEREIAAKMLFRRWRELEKPWRTSARFGCHARIHLANQSRHIVQTAFTKMYFWHIAETEMKSESMKKCINRWKVDVKYRAVYIKRFPATYGFTKTH